MEKTAIKFELSTTAEPEALNILCNSLAAEVDVYVTFRGLKWQRIDTSCLLVLDGYVLPNQYHVVLLNVDWHKWSHGWPIDSRRDIKHELEGSRQEFTCQEMRDGTADISDDSHSDNSTETHGQEVSLSEVSENS